MEFINAVSTKELIAELERRMFKAHQDEVQAIARLKRYMVEETKEEVKLNDEKGNEHGI